MKLKRHSASPRKSGLTISARGAGRSYNDAALIGGGIMLDMRGMNAITSWDPATGLITAQPGVTLEQVWHKVEPDGWWPPVVSGTMTTTLGGCLAANIHGKNNFKMGPIGEHVVEFTAILPTGAEITCSPKKNGDLFYSMISGLGNAWNFHIHHHANETHLLRTFDLWMRFLCEIYTNILPVCLMAPPITTISSAGWMGLQAASHLDADKSMLPVI